MVAWLFKNGKFVEDVPWRAGQVTIHLLVLAQLAWNLNRGDTRKSTRYHYPNLLWMENQKRMVPNELNRAML